jgi:hypothetical protein
MQHVMQLVTSTSSRDRPALMEVVQPIIRKLLPPSLTDDNTDAGNHTSVLELIFDLPTPAPSSLTYAVVGVVEQHLAELLAPDCMNGNDATPSCTAGGIADVFDDDGNFTCVRPWHTRAARRKMTLRDLGLFSVMVYGVIDVFVHFLFHTLSACKVTERTHAKS